MMKPVGLNDDYFRVDVITQSPNAQQVVFAALHQDYSEGYVCDSRDKWPTESNSGKIAIDRCLKFKHWGVAEHPAITFNCGWYPHSVMQQLRTHRVGVSFDVQSGRYTGQRYLDVVSGDRHIEEVFYLRPPGHYTDRQGHKYEYTHVDRDADLEWCFDACMRFKHKMQKGFSEEHARGTMPFDVRQHFVLTANVRSLMHILDLRWKADAQLEAQKLCEDIWPHFHAWVPELADFYLETRAGKGSAAP